MIHDDKTDTAGLLLKPASNVPTADPGGVQPISVVDILAFIQRKLSRLDALPNPNPITTGQMIAFQCVLDAVKNNAIEASKQPFEHSQYIAKPFVREILREWLVQAMSDISEEHYAAGWMQGLESDLWMAILRLPETTSYGMGILDVARLEKLKLVSGILGEWTDGEVFIPLSQWDNLTTETKPKETDQ